MASLSQRHLI
ncbi:hypothetical protein GQ600_1013 [Phytophthora cactorum]|nr:hypothetical protein GQ600_1013 [Phytophthora cactorum]